MKNKIKGLLALALAAFTSLTWAAELVIPYTFDGKTGNTEYAYEYQVKMPETALTSFTTTIRYAGGNHRVEILSVKLLDGETEYTAVATGTEGQAAGTHEGSYSGGNSYNNVYTFTNDAGFTANKTYTLQANLKVTNNPPSHNGNIKVSGGITLYAMPYAFGVNFTKDDSNVTTDATLGYATEGYAAPAAWINVAGASGGYTSIAAPNAMSYTLTWSANGGWNSGNAKDADSKNLLYGYLDDVASGARKKASVTITGLPADRKYAVAVILSGDGADGKDAFNNVYSPVLINGQTYSYDADGNLLTGEAAMAATTWGDRRASASTDGTLTIGKNVMFVEDLSGSELTITSALDAAQISRLTIAGIQVWISEETVTPTASASALPEGAEVISINFDDSNDSRKVTGSAGIYTVDGWNNISGESGSASSLTVSDGTTQVPQAIDFSFSSNNSYRWDNATDVFLKGYLDDGGNRAQVTLNNIPFEKYSVIVYTATDSGTNYRFATVQINNKVYIGTPYATSIGYAAEVEGMGAIWGQACQKTAAYGVNALRVDGLSGNLSIQGGSNANNARGGIAAIQIVNTGDSILSDVQKIDWTEQAVENMKVSELPEIKKALVELTLPAGATLIVDELPTVALNILSDGAVTLNVTNLSISQAQLDAYFNAAGVTGGITDNYTETLGYTKDGVTYYPLIFRGTTDANWATLSNWYIGTRTNGTDTYWIPYDKTVVPGATGSDEWRTTLVDGELMAIAAGEDGYETVNAPKLEGWASKITVASGAHLKLQDLVKLQGACEWHIEDSSKITLAAFSNGNNDDSSRKFYVNAPEGLTVGGTFGAKVAYYFDEDGSAAYATLNNPQTIAGLVLDLGTTAEGRKVVSRKLIGFTGGGATFTVPNGAVTTTAEDVTLETADILQNVGQYKFEKKDDGYYVSYVAYAETDEIGAMNIWTATVDGNWNTAGNWSSSFVPAANADATIEISENTTITIPAEGVTVGVLTVNGEGTLTIAGGKITATKILANVSITANENTLALAPMNIEAGKTVAYTIDTIGDQKVPALTGAGTFVKAGTGMLTIDKDSACDAFITVNAGTLRFHEYAYDKTYNIVAKDGAKIQVGTWAGSLTSTSNTLKLEGGAMLQLNNGNAATGAIVKGTIVIDSTAEKPAVIKGNKNGNNGVIAATIKGNGVLEIQDDNDNFFTISGVIANGDAEGDVLAVKVVTDRGVTFTGANTYTGGTIVVDGGVLKVQKMSALGAANTEVNIAKGGKVTVTSTGNVTEDSGVARAVFAGEGTVEFNGAGYYVLPNNFKAPAYLINNQADNLTISTDGTYEVGSYSGEKYFRMDYNEKGDRDFVITQRADATIASDIVQMFGSINDAQRLTDVTVKGVNGATLTLSGAHDNIHFRTLTIDATGSVNLAGGWKGDVDAYGIIAGTGTIGGKLKLQNGATLNVSAGALNVTGEVWVMNGANNTASVTLPENYAVHTPIISCSNAEAVAADLSAKMPTGYKCVADGNTVKLAAIPVAQIGDVEYATLQAAVDEAEAGATITLLADVVANEAIVVENSVTIDLNEKTITGAAYPVIRIQNGANVTIKNGTITNNDYVFVLGASDLTSAGNLTIESGSYTGVTTVASVTKGTLTIKGGTFAVDMVDYGATYLLNCYDATYKSGDAKIEVTGGTFKGFNPADNTAEGAGTNFCADGFKAVLNEETGYYEIVDAWTAPMPELEDGESFSGDYEYTSEVLSALKAKAATSVDVKVNGVELKGDDAIKALNAAVASFDDALTFDGTAASLDIVIEVTEVNTEDPAASTVVVKRGETVLSVKTDVKPTVKYIDLATGEESETAPETGAVIFKLVF